MPIVEEGTQLFDQLIKPLDLEGGIGRQFKLPDITGALAAGGDVAKELYTGDGSVIPARSSALSNVGIELGTAGLSVNVGLPTSDGIWGGAVDLISILPEDLVSKFEVAFDGARTAVSLGKDVSEIFKELKLDDFPSEVGEQLVKAFENVLGPAMNVISGIAQVATSFLPIFGSLVRVANALAQIFGGGDGDSTYVEPTVPAMSFHPDVDLEFANIFVLRAMRGARSGGDTGDARFYRSPQDLNGIFHPVGRGVKQSVRVKRGDKPLDIYRLSGSDVSSMREQKWVGMMPGSTLLDRGWDVATDGKVNSGTRPLGALLPTAADMGSKLWGMVMNPGSPLMYSVNPESLRKHWANYLWSLRREVEVRSWWSDSAKAHFINEVAGDVYGWSTYPQGEGSLQGDRSKLVAVDPYPATEIIDKDISYNIQNSVPIAALDNLIELQRGAMDHTLVCAYVDERFHIPNKDRWRDNRMLLLQHPDRCKVDVDSIPDKDYRDAMIAAKVSCGSGGMYIAAPPRWTNIPDLVEVKQGLSSMRGSTEELTGEGESGGKGLLLAAAVLGLIVMAKGKR